MDAADTRVGSAQRRRSKSTTQARASVLNGPAPLAALPAPLVDRLQLTWQSLPPRLEAKVYSPSTAQSLPVGNNGSSPATAKPAAHPSRSASTSSPPRTKASSTQPFARVTSADVAAFEQKYAVQDPLMRYVLHVIRTGSSVRRSEIPRGKHIQRKICPEEDVLYLVPCEAPPCGFRNVYWLTFTDEGHILRDGHAEYFTLSSHGLTRFKGGQGVEFSDLPVWVDEKRAFDHMTSMKGLERIQQMIFFFSWKRQAVQRRLHRVQERLACSLFTCHPVAAQLLMDVRDACAEIEREAERKYIGSNTSYTLELLARIQQDRARDAKAAIAKKICALCVSIDSATRSISRYRDGEECSYAITDHEAFSKSLRLSSLRARMFTFLRLVDCHLAEAIYQHVTVVVRDLRSRICGQPRQGEVSVVKEERSGSLCELDTDRQSLDQACQRVTFTVHGFESCSCLIAFPGLYVRFEEDVDFEGDVSTATMHFSPSKVQVFELVHSVLLKYCVAMDGLPRVLTDAHFEHVLTPFVPLVRRAFGDSMLKPSHLALGSYEQELREMRAALEMHYRRIGILQQEHLRCVRAIKVAERESPVESTKQSALAACDEEDAQLPELPDFSTSAAAYELAQKTWGRFVQYADTAAPMLQVGYLLLDQRSLVEKLRAHVSKRVAEMDDALPSIYQQFLASLLQDVDGRIEKVTKIPTTLAEANTWLAQVTSMMPIHPFRQRIDTKCVNLARLRALIKERGVVLLDQETQDAIRKLELTWESVIETLLMCLARVEERGSEHRRSVQDVITKVDDFINGQLQAIVLTFEGLSSGCEEDEAGSNNPTAPFDASKTEELVQQLEDLVAIDLERKNVVQQFEEYDREHRALMEMPPLQQPVWTSTRSENVTTVSLTDKLPSELLLLYIVTSLELRQWFQSWNKMRDKWLGSPLTGVHPGTMINRIKQFRRRLSYASSRLSRLSSVLLQALPFESTAPHQEYSQDDDEDQKKRSSFSRKDFELMRAFDGSIEEMLNCNRIFQAISGGAVSEARWTAINHLLNIQPGLHGAERLTLRRMKEQCTSGQIEAFLEVCDECIVEAKLHVKLEQARQRLARVEVRVEETNYSVRCEGVAEALAQLDDIAMDLKLCLFGQNPELQACLVLREELERKVTVCGHILAYQKHWRLRCEATKLHEVDEFFSKRFGGSGGGDSALPRPRRSQQKSGLKQEHSVWQEFLDASHAWSDHLRRLFFVSSHQTQGEHDKASRVTSLGRKPTASPPAVLRRRLSIATKATDCTLSDVVESFEGFDFETNFAACERGMNLVQTYLNSLREKTPRMFCLDEEMMLRLLLRDSDVRQLHQSLAVCFPRVHRFAICRAANRIGSTVEPFGKQEAAMPVKASNTDGTIVIVGIEGLQADDDAQEQSGRFRLPVAKIGRVKFWFTRLEEEMSSLVVADLKRAFEWVTSGLESVEVVGHNALLPQSIATACGLLFTYEVNRALHDEEEAHQKLHKLRLKVNGRLEELVTARKTASASIRLESMIILSVLQSQVVRNVVELTEEGRHEDAVFFWSLQFQIRAFVEATPAPGSAVQPSPGKHGKLERSELLPSSSVSMKLPPSNHSGQSISMSVCCQVAHLQLPLGQEFVGWERLAIVSPFTQRCAYALFSALKMHHSALVVPYNAGQDPMSLLSGVGSMLMRPSIEFSCHSSAGVAAIHHLDSLMSATSRLHGFLIVRHLLHLSAALVGAVQQRMLQHFHQESSTGPRSLHHSQQAVANSLVLPRQHGGLTNGASAIFVPMDSVEDLHQSGLVQSIRTRFRAVGVTRSAIRYVAECLLLADGFTHEQIKELRVVEAFEAAETEAVGSFDVNFVVREARRLREVYRVVWSSHSLTTGGNAIKTLLQGGKSSGSAVGRVDICDGQCIFHHAFQTAIKKRLTVEHDEGVIAWNKRVALLLAEAFPLSEGGRLVPKGKGDEEAVAAAVSIYLESAYSLPADCAQFGLIMDLWRALQTFPAAVVCGAAESGKSCCITALHRALVALELSERSQENEDSNSQTKSPPAMTQLVVLNPQLLALDQFYASVAVACSANESGGKKPASSSLKWVLVDGELDGSVLDRLLLGDNRAVSSASSLPSASVLYRGPTSSVLSGDYADTRPRLLFEAIEMTSLSPSALSKCWMLHVPTHCITVSSIIGAWRARWERQLGFPPGSRGFEAATVVFKTVDVLVSSVCVRFVLEEIAPDQGDQGTINSVGLRLACLSLNHMTQTALKLVSLCCFQNRSLLQELSFVRLVELVAFAVLWGFGGHLADPLKHKLENFVRVKSKEYSETKHLADVPRGLMDVRHFEDVWDELQPKLAAPLALQPSRSRAETEIQSSFDVSGGQTLVLVPASTSIVRLCTLLLHSFHSFLLIGPAASGKTSLLHWLVHRNREAEAAEMKVETSIDERHVHGILDWTAVPAAWFNPLDERHTSADSRAKVREETELFAGRSKHSFVFLDDLDASGETAQAQFVRSMLDHGLGYNTKRGGFQATDKLVGAAMRLDETAVGLSAAAARLIRHFTVFRVPTYSQKDLLSVFRVKFQRHFRAGVSRASTERRLSAKGGVDSKQLRLEEVVLRASVDFAAEISSLQQQEDSQEHPCLFLFNLHHVNTLLERTLAFATEVSDSRIGATNQGTSLVMLGKAHQSWVSELHNLFLANCPPDSPAAAMKTTEPGEEPRRAPATAADDTQRKVASLLRHLSEKYFSVALRASSDSSFPVSVEALHFLVKLAEYHAQAPLLQPRLVQLRELLNEHMTAANGVSRRSSDQARGTSGAGSWVSSPVELVSNVLLEIAAASSSSEARRPYSAGQLTAIEMKLLLSSAWCVTQIAHLVHALRQQQQIVVSSSLKHSRLLAERLLRFACDFHGFKVHKIEDSIEESSSKQTLKAVLAAAGIRQERVALWVHQEQLRIANSARPTCLAHLLQELCLDKLPSIALLPGGEELRDELVLSCIQSRKQLEVVTEANLLSEFQQRLKDNFRLCIIEEGEDAESSPHQSLALVRRMKTRPSCHWRRMHFAGSELQRFLPEMARAALTSPALCGLSWDVQLVAKSVVLCQRVHARLISASRVAVDPTAQQNYFLSFLANLTVAYRATLASRDRKVAQLETCLGTLAFARHNVVPALVRQKQKLELDCERVDDELESVSQLLEQEQSQTRGDHDDELVEDISGLETEEARWTLRSRHEELMMRRVEMKHRLDEVLKFLAEWQHVGERMSELLGRWTAALDKEKRVTEFDLLAMAMLAAAQRSYTHVTALPAGKRKTSVRHLHNLIFEGLRQAEEDEGAGVSKLIWTSRFPFLRNPDVYHVVRLADEVCDRVPVLVDPSGVLQRFLVHIFSGHTLYSTLPGCGAAGEVESENPSLSKESVVVSCDDPKLEALLQDAQRLAVPVLLINFRSVDKELLRRLQPFLRHASLSHAPPRRAMLQELTLKFYEDQRKQKQRRTSIAGSAMAAMSSLAQTAVSIGGGAALMARRTMKDRLTGRHKAAAINPMAVAPSTLSSDPGKVVDRRDGRPRNGPATGSTTSSRGFQLYAVSAAPVPLPVQHELASQFAHCTVSVPDSELAQLVELSRVGKVRHSLLQELRADQIGLADCWVRMLQSRDELRELLVKLTPAAVHDKSPFAARKASGAVAIQVGEQYSELAALLGLEHQAELIWNSREQVLQAKYAELASASNAYAPLATRVVGIARCVAVTSSLELGTRTSPFYPQSFRYLENAVSQQLAVQSEDSKELLASDAKALLARIGSGFVSESHLVIFRLLETLQRQEQARRSSRSGEVSAVWVEAVVWLLTSAVRSTGAETVEVVDGTEQHQRPALSSTRWNSLKWPGDSGASLVERLRRRVQLCAYLFNGWKPSRANRATRGQPANAPRHSLTGGSVRANLGNPDSTASDADESKALAIARLQEGLDEVLSAAETLWYEWKTNRVRLQLDAQRLIRALGYEEVLSQSSNAGPTTLIGLKEFLARYKLTKARLGDEIEALLPLLLAKTFYQSSFASVLREYLGQDTKQLRAESEEGTAGAWTAWQPPASLAADIAPPRGKNSRAHLPRALILYTHGERKNVSLRLSSWDIAVFVEAENVSLREELTMLITSKHKFVLEVLDAEHAEAALALVSLLINENALLSVPEWYLLATCTVATAIENGKLAVVDRIAVNAPADEGKLSLFGRDHRIADLSVKHKLVEDCGLPESSASALILAVLSDHCRDEDTGAVVRELEDLVLHCGSIEEASGDRNDQERATERLGRLLTENQTLPVSSWDRAASTAKLSSELLSDLLSVASPSLDLLTGASDEEWMSRHAINDGDAACERLWSSCELIRALYAALKIPSADRTAETPFFPWQSFDAELMAQATAFDSIDKRLASLRWPASTAARREANFQQEFASLARGCLPFDWVESFFAGTGWPSQSIGAVSVAQIVLLMACRVGVLVRCLRGDRALALNLAVVGDACEFLRRLRLYTASRNDVPETALVLMLELDASCDVTDTSSEAEAKKRKAVVIVNQLGALGVDTRESEWHGAVLRQTGGGVEAWGVRVEGLVLIERAKATKLYPMPTCRITCQRRNESTSVVEAPVVVLPSLSPYQPHPEFQDGAVGVVLGRSIKAVVDIGDSSTPVETMQHAVGVPVFPDGDSS